MTYLGSKIGCQIKFLPSYLRLLIVGCLTLILQRERVLVHQPRSQLVESVGRIIMVIASLWQTIALVMERAATRLGIELIQRFKTRVVVKLNQVVLMLMLWRTITFILFTVEVSKRLLLMWWPICWSQFNWCICFTWSWWYLVICYYLSI